MRSLLNEREGVRLLTEESEAYPPWEGVKLILAEGSEVKRRAAHANAGHHL